MNCVNLIGRLAAEPEVRYTQTNIMVTQFNLAVNRAYAKPEDKEKADFITVLAWNKTAEFVSKYFRKGQQVGVTGRIETGSYDDKDGKRVYTTKVVAEHVYFADSKKEDTANPFAEPANNQNIIDDSDLPF